MIGYGTLPDKGECEQSSSTTRQAIDLNFTSVVSLLTALVPQLERMGRGVRVIDVKPGRVDTPMTAHVERLGARGRTHV